MNTTKTIPSDFVAILRADFAVACEGLALAQQTLDLEMEQRAIVKYKGLCDTCHAMGIALDSVVL